MAFKQYTTKTKNILTFQYIYVHIKSRTTISIIFTQHTQHFGSTHSRFLEMDMETCRWTWRPERCQSIKRKTNKLALLTVFKVFNSDMLLYM